MAMGAIGGGVSFSQPRPAFTICQQLGGKILLTGESRYRTDYGSDTCYTNQYFEASGDELYLGCMRAIGAPVSSTDDNLIQYATWIVQQDNHPGDCSDVTFTYRLRALQSFRCRLPQPWPYNSRDTCVDRVARETFVSLVTVSSCVTPRNEPCQKNCRLFVGRHQRIIQPGGVWDSFSNVETRGGCRTEDVTQTAAGPIPYHVGDVGCLDTLTRCNRFVE